VQYHKGGGIGNTSNNGHSDSDEAKTSKKGGGTKMWKRQKEETILISEKLSVIIVVNVSVEECWSGKCIKEMMRHTEEEESSDSKHVMLMATIGLESDDESWYIDTGCYNHITGHKE